MRIVVDTNVRISALISRSGPTDRLYGAWKENRFELVTSQDRLEESQRATRYPRVRKLVDSSAAGTHYNQLSASTRYPPNGQL